MEEADSNLGSTGAETDVCSLPRPRFWKYAAAITALLLVVLAVLVVAAPIVEKRLLEKINAAFSGTPGKNLEIERVKIGVLGIWLIGVRFSNDAAGFSIQSPNVFVGPWWELFGGISGRMEEGLVVVEDLEKALAPGVQTARISGTLSFGKIGMEVGIRGTRMVLGGTSGEIVLSENGVVRAEASVERVNGEKAGLYIGFTSTGENHLSLRLDALLFRKFLPEGMTLNGQIRFVGNLKIAPLAGAGRLDLENISLVMWDMSGAGISGNLQTRVDPASWSFQATFFSGRLKTRLAEYDFTNHAATLNAGVAFDASGYNVQGSFTVPQGASLSWSGAVATAAPDIPPTVNVTLSIEGFPLGPLIKSDTVNVTSDGVVARKYVLAGVWPNLEIRAETSIRDLGIMFPSVDLAVEGIESGEIGKDRLPLEGRWQTQKE